MSTLQTGDSVNRTNSTEHLQGRADKARKGEEFPMLVNAKTQHQSRKTCNQGRSLSAPLHLSPSDPLPPSHRIFHFCLRACVVRLLLLATDLLLAWSNRRNKPNPTTPRTSECPRGSKQVKRRQQLSTTTTTTNEQKRPLHLLCRYHTKKTCSVFELCNLESMTLIMLQYFFFARIECSNA